MDKKTTRMKWQLRCFFFFLVQDNYLREKGDGGELGISSYIYELIVILVIDLVRVCLFDSVYYFNGLNLGINLGINLWI